MSHKTHILVAIVLSCSFGVVTVPRLHAQSAGTTELVVEVSGLASRIGAVQVTVFASEEEWLNTPLQKQIVDLATTQSDPRVAFSLPQGEYGIVVTHDLNENGEHDVNLFGKPVEPFGFSNNISHLLSAPSWQEAIISLSDSMTIQVRLETR